MRKAFTYILFAIIPSLVLSCGKDNNGDNPENSFALNRADIIGTWKVIQAKYDEGATMTAWAFEDTYATFEENGLYKGEGYFGNGEGTYSVSGNVITTKVDNVPYIVYEVTGMDGDKANLTATIQKNQMKIWMVVEKSEIVNIDPPTGQIDDSTVLNQEGQVITFICGIYSKLAEFSERKIAIEERLLSGDFSFLKPEDSDLLKLWNSAYYSLNPINTAINALENNGNGFVSKYIPHLHALRAFVAYNLTSLWGDVPYTTSSGPDGVSIWKSEDVLKEAAKDIELYLTYYTFDSNRQIEWYQYLNPIAQNVLLGEIKLTQGKPNEAKGYLTLNLSDERFQSGNMIFCLLGTDANGQQEITSLVYYTDGVQLLEKEANGHLEGLVDSWKTSNHYGMWQMLKRLGKAQEYTNCQQHQLLFPYPKNDAEYWLHQNEGY